MSKIVMLLAVVCVLGTGCATMYSPTGMVQKYPTPEGGLEIVTYGHGVQREEPGASRIFQYVAETGGIIGLASIIGGPWTAAIATVTSVLAKQNRARIQNRVYIPPAEAARITNMSIWTDDQYRPRIVYSTATDSGVGQTTMQGVSVIKDKITPETAVK